MGIEERILGFLTAGKWRLRTSLIVLLLLATLVPYLVLGFGLVLYRVPAIAEEERQHIRQEAETLARYFELLLGGVEGRLGMLATRAVDITQDQLASLIDAAFAEGGFQAIYLLDESGRVLHAALPGSMAGARINLRGADFSQNPLYLLQRELGWRVWSDRYLSPVTGNATVGLAVPGGPYVLLGEMKQGFADEWVAVAVEELNEPVMIIDRAGELVAGRRLSEADALRNWLPQLPAVPGSGGSMTVRMDLGGGEYEAGLARSGRLGWTFVTTVPAGLDNKRIRISVLTVVIGVFATLLVSLALAPLWASRLNESVRLLARRTHELAKGEYAGSPVGSRIIEFDALSADMESMAKAVQQRQEALEQSEERLRHTLDTVEQLNLGLESRVERRTAALAKSNRELAAAMETLKMAQGELLRNEKLAALGNMVGGVAHELNTPIGNGVMAVSTLHDDVRRFRHEMAAGLRRSTLDRFVDRLEAGAEIAQRNLERANELITSFKQVAVDQGSARRRRFELAGAVREILLTLQPMLERASCTVQVDIAPNIEMDSYPGPLGQVIANLVSNAVMHGFEGRAGGCLELTAAPAGDGQICILISDDGIGISPDVVDRIFDPFFTTRLGRGGTGIGLHVVWNAVTVVLGGTVTVASTPGRGTTFRIMLPLEAPRPDAA